MKIHILYPFKDGPWGGANQFLKAIKVYFVKKGCYENSPDKADVILFNCSPFALLSLVDELYKLKKKNPDLLVFIRLDGPVYLIRNADIEIDNSFYFLNKVVADGAVFQSGWSRRKNIEQGMRDSGNQVVIVNAPDANIFNKLDKAPFFSNDKIRIIATSWSSNFKKGFSDYKWLDENLDFSKYEMLFVGNSPIKFSNIKHMSPIDATGLAMELKKSDIYITASQKDPCSNSLIEALNCGLPAIALNDGGHPELIGSGGELFSNVEEVPRLLEKIVADYSMYQNNLNLPNLDQVGEKYYDFMYQVFKKHKANRYISKGFSFFNYFFIKVNLMLWRIKKKVKELVQRLF